MRTVHPWAWTDVCYLYKVVSSNLKLQWPLEKAVAFGRSSCFLHKTIWVKKKKKNWVKLIFSLTWYFKINNRVLIRFFMVIKLVWLRWFVRWLKPMACLQFFLFHFIVRKGTATRRLELFQGRACSYSAYWSRNTFKWDSSASLPFRQPTGIRLSSGPSSGKFEPYLGGVGHLKRKRKVFPA